MPVCRGTLFWARPRRRCVLISRIFNIFWFGFFQSARNWVIQNYFQSIGTVSATWQTGRGKVIRQHTITVICCSRNFYWAASSCTRPNTALWRPAVRQLWSDGFRRLMNRFGRASSMLWLWWFTNRLPIIAWNFAFPADFWCRGYSQEIFRCVTKRKQKVAAFLRRLM